MDRESRAWIEVRAAELRRNLATLRSALPDRVQVIAMVKADAYGLGALRAVQALAPAGPWGYGVATVEEGRALRSGGVEQPIIVFSPLAPASFRAAVESRLTVVLSDLGHLPELAEAARATDKTAEFQIEIDTGMGRAGLDFRDVARWRGSLEGLPPGLRWTGCFTHFHSADQVNPSAVRVQWQRFQDTIAQLPATQGGLQFHACNSAASLRVPEYASTAIRPGIFLYGGNAGDGLGVPSQVVTVRARCVLVREVPPGTTLGYGATHRAEGWSRWATVAIGYGDGLPRALGNRGFGLVRGVRVPIIGRISMDLTVVDITGLEGVEAGEPVTFIGEDGDERITLSEVAGLVSTIDYEILTGFSPRLPRIWIEDGSA